MAEPKKTYIFARMKKTLTILCLLLVSAVMQAQSYKLELSSEIPAAAGEVLQQRFAQMLQSEGLKLADDGTPLTVTPKVVGRTELGGSQVALVIELTAVSGEAQGTFNIKGVGEGDDDAWLRAVKQLLPRSQDAQKFVKMLK